MWNINDYINIQHVKILIKVLKAYKLISTKLKKCNQGSQFNKWKLYRVPFSMRNVIIYILNIVSNYEKIYNLFIYMQVKF